MISEKDRDALSFRLLAIDTMRTAIGVQLAPYHRMLEQLADMTAAAELEHDVEVAGRCEGCNRLLLTGDKGHEPQDAGWLCEECSPTWSDCLAQCIELTPEDLDFPEDHAEGLAKAREMVDAGHGDVKHVWVID